jgi:2-polyprenyl-3-methyl-5-hydroxy-6-metoxy-1,4-benzoquinol methylase
MGRVNYIKKRCTGKILDVGYYACTLHEEVLKAGGEKNVFGIDTETKNNTKHYKKATAEKIPFKANMFDTLIAGELVEHLKNPKNFVKEAWRVLKKGGALVLTTPNRGSLINRIFHNNETPIHFSLFTWPELRSLLEKTGFEVADYSAMAYDIESSGGSAKPWSFKIRGLSDFVLPKSLREELVVTVRKK